MKTSVKDSTSCLLKRNLKDSGAYLSRHVNTYRFIHRENKIPVCSNTWHLCTSISYFMHVSTALWSECKFSLKEKTLPAANVRTSSTALRLSPGVKGGAGTPYCAPETENQQTRALQGHCIISVRVEREADSVAIKCIRKHNFLILLVRKESENKA